MNFIVVSEFSSFIETSRKSKYSTAGKRNYRDLSRMVRTGGNVHFTNYPDKRSGTYASRTYDHTTGKPTGVSFVRDTHRFDPTLPIAAAGQVRRSWAKAKGNSKKPSDAKYRAEYTRHMDAAKRELARRANDGDKLP